MVEKPGRGRRDAADWYPYFLLYETGTLVAEIADRMGLSASHVFSQLRVMRKLAPADREALRQEALRRRFACAEHEYLVGEPLKATRLFNSYTALCRAERAAKVTFMTEDKKAKPMEAKHGEGGEDVERLRSELIERLRLLDAKRTDSPADYPELQNGPFEDEF